MSAEILLSHLQGLRRSGAGRWIARCPAHEDRRASLCVRELDDGRVLLHCFAGCATAAVLAAVGLDFSALFPPRRLGDALPPLRRPFPAADVLRALAFEALVVCQYARSLEQGGVLTPNERQRLHVAVCRLQHAVEVACHE